ncbi:hypothetical protein EPUS_08704 [Endocarpon pusillum Z07020]|uniref:FAD-binding domain-containing protein n=1 Tax=Endocarpon pusillum (strain Z07020 / HMAS-L-300199) TaxID=1263415 RepID=U1GLW2_ENDPU|nr:uncharacterized protein EPUS_08704 [Endocarpon pusillum Z07020]ERF72896.1 hypothetical protein EPUS_08704 [Endocarpon pusillum Z07020]
MVAADPWVKEDALKVIIVGGSVAGLTLAHCLYRAGIDYVVLEAREDIAPKQGASIGIFANGARILDQLGIYGEIEEWTDPPVWHEVVTGKGDVVSKLDPLALIQTRLGYPINFLERQQAFKSLYTQLPDRSKVLTGKKVTSVVQQAEGIIVSCTDGSQFVGDVVAGADGVHSRVRQEMWRHVEMDGLAKSLAKDKKAMSAEYRCLYGMSSGVPGLEEKHHYRAVNKDWSFLTVVGKSDCCYWFVFEKLDRIYHTPNIPRYVEADQLEFIKPFLDRYVSHDVQFQALWERRTAATLASLEEAQFSRWTHGRIVCLGDSIHKMTPSIGQGGNFAIESAAALTNRLYALAQSHRRSRPGFKEVESTLADYQDRRHQRAQEVYDAAAITTRLETLKTPWHRFMQMQVVPRMGDMLVDVHCQVLIQAPQLDFLPVPPRSVRGTMPFQTPETALQKESMLWRVFRAAPLLGLCTVAGLAPGPSMSAPQYLQDFGFLGALISLQVIGIIECIRRGNYFTISTLWPFFLTFALWKDSLASMIPIFHFLHYVQSPLRNYAAADNRLTVVGYAKTIVVSIIFGFLVPTILYAARLGSCSPWPLMDEISHQALSLYTLFWQLSPLWVMLTQRILVLTTVVDTTARDRIQSPRADLSYLRWAYGFAAAASGIPHLYEWAHAPRPITGYMSSLVGNRVTGAAATLQVLFSQFDQTLLSPYHLGRMVLSISGLIWVLLHVRDLKRAKRTQTSWLRILAVGSITTLLGGSGTAMVVGWAWREEILAAAGSQGDLKE